MTALYLITGAQAAGKSTVAQAMAERLDRSVHLRGDTFRRWIVGGREEMTLDAGPEAHRQLALRHRLTADVATAYWSAGFTVVVQDVILGEHLPAMVEAIPARPLHVVVLDPSVEAIVAREGGRTKVAYRRWDVAPLVAVLREQTPRIGTWLDTSALTVDDTVEAILRAPPTLV